MFGFMKKHSERDREEKERKKKEKKDKKEKKKSDKPMTPEELYRLEEAKKGLFRRLSDATKYPKPHSSKNGGATVTPSQSNESLNSSGKNSPREESPDNATYTSSTKIELSKAFKVPPPVRPKPKKGILKGNSSYGPGIPNQGVRGDLDDTQTLEDNTMANEMMSGAIPGEAAGDQSPVPKKQRSVKSMISNFEQPDSSLPIPNQSFPTGSLTQRSITSQRYSVQNQDSTEETVTTVLEFPPTSPAEKTYSVELKLPSVAPPRCPQPRQIILRRQPAGDFGFTLRRGTVLERGLGDNSERKRTVIFAEPGPKNTQTGLLPGDRLIEVNGQNVENSTREDIIELIKGSGNEAALKVQPIPELSELSMRSGLQGGDVMIEQHSVKTGTLQRSGSMRYKTKQAKSEDQVASEKAWLSGEKVWLVHKGGFASGHLQNGDTTEGDEGKCKVTLDHGGEVLDVDEEDVEKANPPQFDRVEDLATLRYLNESSLLHTLRQRYGSNLIHSHAGRSLLIINPMHPLSVYSEKVIHMFRGCKPEDMPPHIYAIAQTAYRNMLNTRLDQSLVLLGRSGSGKTANARHALHYFTITAGSVCNILTVEKLNAIFTLLDAFGNSRTILNTSATRFSQIFSLDFDHAGQIAAASIQILMLEKTRITKRPEGEPTFHIFYQLLAGLDSSVRKELQLENLNDPNLFMTPLQRAEDRQRATQAWAKIHHSMTVLGFIESETKAIYSVLAGIYHLGVAAVVKGVHNKYQFARPAAAQKAAAVLGTKVEELARAIFSPQSKTPYRGTPEKTGPAETVSGLEALEGFVVGLYSEVFNALVSLINRSLSSNYRTISSLLIVDTPGFQNPASCGRTTGATFEDLCYNYEQERLQLLFHDTVFTSQQDLYSQENVDCDFEMMSSSPGPMVNLIDKPSDGSLVRSGPGMQDAQQKGLLWVLDEEAIYPGNTDEAFLQRILSTYKYPANTKRALIRACDLPNSFQLNHFQGTNPVQYNTKGWLKASRENPVTRVANTFLQDSHKEDVNGLFSTLRGPLATTVSGSVVGIEGSSSLRRASSIRRAYTTGTAGLKRKSTCLQVKFQMDSIIETLRRTHVHFVHCLLPQHNAGLCDLKPTKPGATEDIMMNVPLVRSQVRGMELVEAIRMHRQGFPEHMMFSEFRRRFEILIPPESKPSGPVVDEKQAVEVFLSKLEVDKSTFRLGLSQVSQIIIDT